MKATPKSDECIKMIQEIEFIGNRFSAHLVGSLTKHLTVNRDEEILQFTRKQFEGLVYWVDYYDAILHYRLLPLAHLKWKNNNSFKHITEESDKDEFLSVVSKRTRTKPSVLWQVLTDYDEVTIDDLKNEFWELIPNLESIEEYYQVMKMKYSEVYAEIPDANYYNYFNLIKDATFMANFNDLIKYGIVKRAEVDSLILNLDRVVKRLDSVCSEILEMYKSFLPEKYMQTTEPVAIPEELDTPEPVAIPEELDTPEAKEIFDKAIQAGFMNSDYSFNGTRYQMAYFAEKVSEHLNLKQRWKPFIQLWDYKYFAQTRRESKELYGYVDKQNEIDKIFI